MPLDPLRCRLSWFRFEKVALKGHVLGAGLATDGLQRAS